jgi:hypothetical protein
MEDKFKIKKIKYQYIKDFIFPILLSIIAAIIFWCVFSYYPEKARQNKIRPKLDLDMYYVYANLYSIFDLAMQANYNSPSNFQSKIKGKKLKKEDIELGLQNKCLNETYLYDDNVKYQLLVIGKSLFERANKIDLTVERLFSFSNYLTADEIILLETIRKKLQVYELSDYNRSVTSLLRSPLLKPVNPSLSYMSQNLFELYELFIQLQELVFNNKYSNRNISIGRVKYYYETRQFNKCKKEINRVYTKYPKDKNYLDFYLFLSEYMSGSKEKSYKMLDNIFKNNPHLVSSRGFLDDLLQYKKVIVLIEKYYSENEIDELEAVLNREKLSHRRYIGQAKSLRKYYRNKLEEIKIR